MDFHITAPMKGSGVVRILAVPSASQCHDDVIFLHLPRAKMADFKTCFQRVVRLEQVMNGNANTY